MTCLSSLRGGRKLSTGKKMDMKEEPTSVKNAVPAGGIQSQAADS